MSSIYQQATIVIWAAFFQWREKKGILQDFAASAKSFFADMLELERGEVEAKKQYYALKAQQIELSNMLC